MKSMNIIRSFVKRNILWVALVAVLVPLLSLLGLQYGSLSRLEKTTEIEYNSKMDSFLYDVQNEVKMFYKTQSSETLNTQAYALTEEKFQDKKNFFTKCEVEGVNKLFIAKFNGKEEPQVVFYQSGDNANPITPTKDELQAVNIAIVPFKLRSQEDRPLKNPMVLSQDSEMNVRMLYKPITDSNRKIVGVGGMLLDSERFKSVILPNIIKARLERYYPDDAQDNVIVTAYDTWNKIYASQDAKGQNDVKKMYLPHYSDWKVAIQSKNMTPAQWARWNFQFNLTLSVLLTLALIAGIALTLKTTAREMKLSQMKADFVSNVSHELRTPLASIRVFGEFMKLGRVKEQDKIEEYGTYIETESSRLTQLINNILDFSRIESGAKTYQFERADLSYVICDTLKTHEVQMKQNGFNVEFDKPLKPLADVEIDTDAISQVFVNLLDNAVKYSGSSKEIKIKLGQQEKFAFVSVTDFGVGIPPEEQSKIFEKFYRVSTGLVHDVKGSGLGLSLVKHIIEAHKGKVVVQSTLSEGSTFTIYLPVAEDTIETTKEKKEKSFGHETNLELQYKQ
jgi:two-component system, OmpR family, phosphate regulon sensor histidine kinase PhoR